VTPARRRRRLAALAALVLLAPPPGGTLPRAEAAERTSAKSAVERTAPAAPAAPRSPRDVETERRAVRARAETVQRELAAAEATRGEAADALRESERAISEANRRLYELAQAQAAARARLVTIANERARVESRTATEQSRLAQLLVQRYAGGDTDPLKLLLSGRAPGDIDRLLFYFRRIGEARAQVIADLAADRERLAALSAEAAAEQKGLDALLRDEAGARAELERDRAARVRVLARIAEDVRRQRRALETLRRDEARLEALLERLARAPRPAPPPARPKPAAPGAAAPAPAAPPVGPLPARRLSVPVAGEPIGRFGVSRESGGTKWKGWFIRCAPGQEVKAVAAGRVVFADWLRGFGNLLILDHGGGWMTLYGNNDALLAAVGAEVREGEPVAQAGASGGSPDSGVYFEVRFDGTAVDPASWAVR
jgi:septal ring factor EnvC (AmiA/AmiB activator)